MTKRMTRREMLKRATVALGGAVGGCSRAQAPSEEVETVPWVEEHLQQLHIGEKVGQLLCISPQSGDPENLVQSAKATAAYLPDGLTAEEVIRLGNHYQDLARLPMLIMGGAEAGLGERVKGATQLPCNMAIGATDSEDMARLAARISAGEAKALGIYWPGPTVCDVNTNPRNQTVNTRSFGDSPKLVARLSTALIDELQKNGCIGWANHFPGNGDATEDPNIEMPVVYHGRERLQQVEMIPFRALIRAGVQVIGVSDNWFPAFEPKRPLPAALSRSVVTRLLREELGFTGVICSDSFSAQAIRRNLEIGEAVLQSFQAGLDMLPAYPDTERCHYVLVNAIGSDPQLNARLDASVRRMLFLKYKTGLHEQRFTSVRTAAEIIGSAEHREGALRIARRAVTLIKGPEFFRSLPQDGRMLFVVSEAQRRSSGEWPHEELLSLLRKNFPQSHPMQISRQPDGEERRRLLEGAGKFRKIVAAAFTRDISDEGLGMNIPENQRQLFRELNDICPTAVCCFGSPYALTGLGVVAALVCTYDDCPASLQAAVELCSGKLEPGGKLPVQLQI